MCVCGVEGLDICCEPTIQVLSEGRCVRVCLHSVVFLCHMQQTLLVVILLCFSVCKPGSAEWGFPLDFSIFIINNNTFFNFLVMWSLAPC